MPMRCSKMKKILYSVLVKEQNGRLLIKQYSTNLRYNLVGFYSGITSLYKLLKNKIDLRWEMRFKEANENS